MLAELNGKGGALCQPARMGELRCPLIVRPTSEDVVTGNIFGTMMAINARWWLPDFLNQSLRTTRFRTQVYRDLRIDLWQKQPTFPAHLLPWEEGQTEVDVEINWENPGTTIFVEMKYGSPLSAKTTHNNGNGKHASDQLIRNARVGLHRCGWYEESFLFDMPRRDFCLVLFSPSETNELVEQYQDEACFRRSVPFSDKITSLPMSPFIGQLSYSQFTKILAVNLRFMSSPERALAIQLTNYLDHKLNQLSAR